MEFFFRITNGEDYLDIDLSETTYGQEEIEEIGFIDPATIRVLPEFLKTDIWTNMPLVKTRQELCQIYENELRITRVIPKLFRTR